MDDTVWQNKVLVKKFLEGVRGGIPFANEQIGIMLRLTRSFLKEDIRFLDLGCGDGVLTSAILNQYPKAQGILVDFSEPMLTQARSKLIKNSKQLRFIYADLGKSKWLDSIKAQKNFNLVVSGFCIHHQPDERKRCLYKEIFSLLKPGGLFINIEHVSSDSKQLELLFNEMMIDTLWAYHRSQKGTKPRSQIAKEFVNRPDKQANILAPVEDQCCWLRKIGFKDVGCYFKSFELAVFGGRKLF